MVLLVDHHGTSLRNYLIHGTLDCDPSPGLIRSVQQTPRENLSSGSGALSESNFSMTGTPPPHVSPSIPFSRPGQSRDRSKSGWDVPRWLHDVVGLASRCNRLGGHYIRLCDDSPAHLCSRHDLEELFRKLREETSHRWLPLTIFSVLRWGSPVELNCSILLDASNWLCNGMGTCSLSHHDAIILLGSI